MSKEGFVLRCIRSGRIKRQTWGQMAFLVACLFILLSVLQSVSSVTANSSTSELDVAHYLPVILEGYPPDITGQVLYSGVPSANTMLDLYFYDRTDWSPIASTTTSRDGRYLFSGIAPLSPGERYYVRYGPNETNPAYLYSWYGPIISTYSVGDSVSGGTFDIADVTLLTPRSGASVKLPFTFTWEPRGVKGDNYRVALLDQASGDYWFTNDLGDVGAFTVNSLPPEIQSGRQYAWYLEVYQGTDSFGESFKLNDIRFVGLNTQQRSPALGGAYFVKAKTEGRTGRSTVEGR